MPGKKDMLTPSLETVIARVESSDRPYAIRFEAVMFRSTPAWVDGTTPAISRINGCNADTARAIACTSYGLFQCLGATLYGDLKYPNPISFFMFDSEQQVTQFRALVTRWGFDWQNFDFTDEALLEKFARRYNGPGNIPGYVSAMKTAYTAINGG